MAQRKKIDYKNYFLAFLITIIVFIFGIFVGDTLNEAKLSDIENLNEDLRYKTLAIQTQFDLVSESPCDFINDTTVFKELLDVSKKTEFMENQLGKDNIQVKRIKNYYSTLLIKSWLFTQRTEKDCPESDLHDIIYFYSNEDDCKTCDSQGQILSNLRKDYDNLRIFSIDYNLDNPALQTLKRMYGVESANRFPILIIDDEVSKGFLSRKSVEEKLGFI